MDDAELLLRHQQQQQQNHHLQQQQLHHRGHVTSISPPPHHLQRDSLHPPHHNQDRESPAATVLDLQHHQSRTNNPSGGSNSSSNGGVGAQCFPSPQPLVINHQSDDEGPPSPTRSEIDVIANHRSQLLPFSNYSINNRTSSTNIPANLTNGGSPTKQITSSSSLSSPNRQSASSNRNHFYLPPPHTQLQPPTPMSTDAEDAAAAAASLSRPGSPARSLQAPIPSLTVTPPLSSSSSTTTTASTSSSSSLSSAKVVEGGLYHPSLHHLHPHLKSPQVNNGSSSSAAPRSPLPLRNGSGGIGGGGSERSLKRPFESEAREDLERDLREAASLSRDAASAAALNFRDSSSSNSTSNINRESSITSYRDPSRDRENRDSSRDRVGERSGNPASSSTTSPTSRVDHREVALALRRRRPRIPSPLPLVSNIRSNMSPPRNYFGERFVFDWLLECFIVVVVASKLRDKLIHG